MHRNEIIRNLIIICLSFLLSYTSIGGTANMQSSLNDDANLGNKSLTFGNLSAMVSNVFATVVVYKLGLKWSLLLSMIVFTALSATNFFPFWYVMYPGAFIYGLGVGPAWSSKSACLTILGKRSAALRGESEEVVITQFFGIFYMFYRISVLTGSLIPTVIIRRPPSVHDPPEEIVQSLCGAHYCYEDLTDAFRNSGLGTNGTMSHGLDNFYRPTKSQINTLFGVYCACSLLAIPLIVLLASFNLQDDLKNKKVGDTLFATVKHMGNPKELLLFPLGFFSGILYAFISADYAVGFISCSVGIDSVGYVMAVVGVSSGLASVSTGPIVKYVGRHAVFALGALCNVVAFVGMLMWRPNTQGIMALCIIVGLLGIALTIWNSQLCAFIGFLFGDVDKEASFAANNFWNMGGICFWHAISMNICLNVQIYIMTVFLVIGLTGYVIVELILKSSNREVKGSVQLELNSHKETYETFK